MKPLPIACTLDAAALAARKTELIANLVGTAASRTELPDGYRLTFAPSSETLALITQAIDAERECCRFLTFQLTVAADGGAFTLDLTGPPGTAQFLADLAGR